MNIIDFVGTALLHSLWQGALIAGLLALTLHLLRGVSPAVRYLVCWVALVGMVAVPVGVVLDGRGGQGGPGGQDGVGMGDFRGVAAPEVGVAEIGNELTTLEEAGVAVQPFLVAFWLVGVLFMLARLGRGWWTVRQLRRLPGEALGEDVLQAIHRLKNRMGISRVVRLVATDQAGEPMLIGWLKPVVLIPTALLAGMPVAHVEAILAHELAHIRRHDYLFAVLQSLFEAVLFYHPAAWWISGKIREERERACDDLAVDAIHSRETYARALAGLEVQRLGGFQLALPAGGGSLLSRIQRLVEPPAPDRLRSSAGALLAVVMVVASGVFVAACSDKTLPGEPLVQDLAALPDELATMIRQADIEGTISYLHERREAGDPEAYQLLLGAFRAAKDLDLKQNMVFVFAHFNTLEGDQELIRIAETDADVSVRQNAIRAINLRTPRDNPRTYGVNFTRGEPISYQDMYPQMSEEQIMAVRLALRRITLDRENPANVSALHAMAYSGDERAFLSELLQSSTDYKLLSEAIVFLAPPEEHGGLFRDLYLAWNGSDDTGMFIMSRLVFSSPSMDGVEVLLSFARNESTRFTSENYGLISGYLDRFSPSERQQVIVRLEEEIATFEADSEPANVLQDEIDRLRAL